MVSLPQVPEDSAHGLLGLLTEIIAINGRKPTLSSAEYCGILFPNLIVALALEQVHEVL